MKKIIGIMGSPRINGNTHKLLEKILDGANSQGAETELVYLSYLTIKECEGCHECWERGECVKRDDMIDLFKKITHCDVMVFGTPVYWYGPTAVMKTFIDRFVYFNTPKNRKKIAGKMAALVSPFEEESPDTADLLVAVFRKCFDYLGIEFKDYLLVPGVTKRGEVVANPLIMDNAYNMGIKLSKL